MTPAFEYERLLDIPPLAWIARVGRGRPVRVRHGQDVETRPEGFVEGAWNGNFEAWDFDRAETLAGSGGRWRDSTLTFAAPFHPLERLFLLPHGDEVLVSNSLAFLLVEAGDGLDLSYPGYFFDVLSQVRRGLVSPPVSIPTASGRRVELYPACHVDIGPDLSLRHRPRTAGRPPTCYADYVGHLLETMAAVAANAASPARTTTYRLVAACSRGYDSTATAALASQVGGREGVTFRRSSTRVGHPLTGVVHEPGEDSGADSLRALGMRVAEFDRADLKRLPGFPTAEFFINSPAAVTDASMQLMESTLRGSVFVSGRHGERYWGPTTRCRRRAFREVDDCHLSGQALGEFRLRAGFVHYPAPYVGALNGPAIYRITHAPEMRPWRLGTGYYDRPIPRRIAEEAGVPRANFGHRKYGAGALHRELNAESEADFRAFVRASVPTGILRTLDQGPYGARRDRHERLTHLRVHYAHWPIVGPALDLLGTERLHVMWNSVHQYQFHWGFEKTRGRYLAAR